MRSLVRFGSASIAVGIALVCMSGAFAATDAAEDVVPPALQNFFPIGVWVPPADSFQRWGARGVNTMIGVPEGADVDAWSAMADQLGLHMIREPRANPADDLGETLLLAWEQPDEPDGIYSQVPYADIQAQYNAWKAIDPNRLVLINFVGDLNQYDLQTGESGDAWYEKYVLGADWVSADKYPVNSGDGDNLGLLGQMMDHLKVLAGTKPTFAFLESSDIDTTDGNYGPTPDQLRAEIWEVIIHGARGIAYFPEQIVPTFEFDTTPAEVVAEMTRQDATISALASVLQGPIDPENLSASVASPLEAGWRYSGSGAYFFVLNLSPDARAGQTVALGGTGSAGSATVFGESRSVPISGGQISDDFGPYAVHIYVVAAADEIFRDGFE